MPNLLIKLPRRAEFLFIADINISSGMQRLTKVKHVHSLKIECIVHRQSFSFIKYRYVMFIGTSTVHVLWHACDAKPRPQTLIENGICMKGRIPGITMVMDEKHAVK